LGLRARVIVIVVVTVFVTNLGWGLSRNRTDAATRQADARSHALQLARALAGPCSVPLATRQIEDLDAILARFADEQDWGRLDLVEVAIVDTEGAIVAHTDPQRFGAWLDDPFSADAQADDQPHSERFVADGEPRLRVSMPIVSGVRWGTVIATVSLSRVERRIRESRETVLTTSLLLAAVLTLVLFFVLDRANRQLSEAAEELERLARTDGLTGLANHRTLTELLDNEVVRAERYGQPLSLMMIDVDHFKAFNDTHGHPAGDVVLVGIAALLRQRLRTVDVAARYGGEEFAVVLPATGLQDATRLAQELVRAVRERTFEGEATQPGGAITISAGVGCWAGAPETAGQLLERADAALYAAKAAGRDRVELAGEPT